jgi:hypothetical protein
MPSTLYPLWFMSKGSKIRPHNKSVYNREWERIFNKDKNNAKTKEKEKNN